jgi:hypothetical protein
MPSLVEFLRARLAEDAESAGEPPTDKARAWLENCPDYNESALLWYNDRLRAEVAAKHAMLTALADHMPTEGDPFWTTYDDGDYPAQVAVAHLALPYASHPDYQQEWAPRVDTKA